MQRKKTSRFELRVSQVERTAVEAAALALGVSQGALVRRALDFYFGELDNTRRSTNWEPDSPRKEKE